MISSFRLWRGLEEGRGRRPQRAQAQGLTRSFGPVTRMQPPFSVRRASTRWDAILLAEKPAGANGDDVRVAGKFDTQSR